MKSKDYGTITERRKILTDSLTKYFKLSPTDYIWVPAFDDADDLDTYQLHFSQLILCHNSGVSVCSIVFRYEWNEETSRISTERMVIDICVGLERLKPLELIKAQYSDWSPSAITSLILGRIEDHRAKWKTQ